MNPKRIEVKERILWFVVGFVACLFSLAFLFGVSFFIPLPAIEIPFQDLFYVA